MSVLSDFLAFLIDQSTSTAPSGDERLLEPGVELETPTRAFHVDYDCIATYVTAKGQIVTRKVHGGCVYPTRIRALRSIQNIPDTATGPTSQFFGLF